jgi:hypothetical protein
MSATPSEIVAEALLSALRAPGMAGRRLVLRDRCGITPEDLFLVLRPRLDEEVTVSTDGGDRHIGALALGPGRVLIPYLVSEPGSAETNQGSAGFAATLRTQFLAGAREERVLLILDPRPVETVLTATEDAAELDQLTWPALTGLALQLATARAGRAATSFEEAVVEAFTGIEEEDRMALIRLAAWLESAVRGSEEAAGRALWQLGCFISDPEASGDPKTLAESAKLRRQLDERFASRSKPWDAEARKLLGRMGVGDAVTECVVAAAGPFGVDYGKFTLADLRRRDGAAPPLYFDRYDPVVGSRAVLREGSSLLVWVESGEGDLELRLKRPAMAGDSGISRWSGRTPAELELTPGEMKATLDLPPGEDGEWLFGVLELSAMSDGDAPAVSEVLQLAIYRSDGNWVPVEDSMRVDAAAGGFECEDEPTVIAYAERAEALGTAHHADAGGEVADEAEAVELLVEFEGTVAAIPLLIRGESDAEDASPPEVDDDDGGQPEPDGPPDEYRSIPHALLDAGRKDWPDNVYARDPQEGPGPVDFLIGARQMRVSGQHPGGVDGVVLERKILAKPEWSAYVWAGPTGTLSRAPQVPVLAGAASLQELEVERFFDTRIAFFSAASAAGGVYGLDPGAPEASAYVSAYSALLRSIPREGRYLSDWDALLLCDAVFVAGSRDLLFAPTAPLAVAFHAGFASEVSSWVCAGGSPPQEDVQAVSMRHAVPLIHARGQWYETAPIEELLWRRYVELSPDAPGLPTRNASFIAHRLNFFLDVHGVYRDPDQELSVAFHRPGDGRIVFDALRAFYTRERSSGKYALPRIHAHLVGGSESIEAEVHSLLARGRQDDLDRLIETRVTVSATAEPPPFAHVTFLFRSPGTRSARHVLMTERPPTDYLGGLAAAPGRKVHSDQNKVFAWGTWAPEFKSATAYQGLITRTLELVGGQPTGKLSPGWTQMASASVDSEALDELYGEQSAWVVHLDRLIGIEAFGGPRQLIEYEERADPDQPGYDGITATEQVDPYLQAVGRALNDLGSPGEPALRRVLQLLNSVSGRWALDLLQKNNNEILQKMGFVTAIAVLEQLEDCLGTHEDGTAVLIALDELLSRRSRGGLPRFSLPGSQPEGQMCDDLLVLWVPRDASGEGVLTVRGSVIEVKYASSGRGSTDDAKAEIERTRGWLHKAFNEGGVARPFRARDLSELVAAAAARAATFNLGRPVDPGVLDPALARIARGDYRLDLTHWRGGSVRTGIVVSVEAESDVATNQSGLGDEGEELDLLRIGRPVLKQLIAGAKVRIGEAWQELSFLPSDSRQGERDNPAPAVHPEPAAVEPERSKAAPTRGPVPTVREGLHGGDSELVELARSLDRAMEKYKLDTEPFRVELAQVGPNVIRFRTRALGPLSVADVERRARDLGREVGATGAVIVSQEPRYICVDVPRQKREPVIYRDLMMEGAAEAARPGAVTFTVGVAPSGEVRVADLARLPHLLVAGATGSGKSVFLRALLCRMVIARDPESLRILLVDPKQLDFAGFAPLPHLVGGRIISDPAEAVEALRGTIEEELERRKPILIGAGATSATEFYEKGGTYEELPQMVVLVDEFADLAAVMDRQERQGFQELIQRYAQLTRAFGIYLVLATQRPSVDVITGSIKANLTARIAFGLPSHRDSMTVLDRSGAEDLLGNGDLLFYVNGQVERLQAPLAEASDVAAAVERWQGVANPDKEK